MKFVEDGKCKHEIAEIAEHAMGLCPLCLKQELEELRAADRDHASARNGMERRLREDAGRRVLEAAQLCAEGYRNNNEGVTATSERAVNEKCAVAASNAGWFALRALGFSNEDIKAMHAAKR